MSEITIGQMIDNELEKMIETYRELQRMNFSNADAKKMATTDPTIRRYIIERALEQFEHFTNK